MNRVKWNGLPLDSSHQSLPDKLQEVIFSYLPPPLPTTPVIEDLAEKYFKGQFTGQDYAAMQAAAFVRPKSRETHEERRQIFNLRAAEALANGFVVPATFRTLVESDEYVDRLHHNSIGLTMPEELWRLPEDPSLLVFLAFTEGQGCCNWHLLLAKVGSHSIVCCEHPFGLTSNWPCAIPDCSQWTVERCADSIEEWLFYYFLESTSHDQQYIEQLRPYHQNEWNE